jgi:CIC family chloride channel protein
MVTMSSGGNGGMFGPSVVVGGLLGFVYAYGINMTGLVQLNITNFIVAGMAAAISGVMHAPLTGIFLIAEITGGYLLMVPLMIVSAISYFINKAVNKYSIYTKSLAEQGNLMGSENRDLTILRMMKLKFLIEKDFIILHPEDTPKSRSADIIHTSRNIFPVIQDDGTLLGTIFTDQLLELIMSPQEEDQNKAVKSVAQPAGKIIDIHTPMTDVMQIMEQQDIRILPVSDHENRYLGFVTKTGILNKYRALLLRQSASFA